jgi:hypothetical protein
MLVLRLGGTAEAKQSIEIQGQGLPITASVYLPLGWNRADQRHEPARLLWIDSICINQGDLKERGGQVRHMTKIYSSAEQGCRLSGRRGWWKLANTSTRD